jgi:anti-sigma B factor antagonist
VKISYEDHETITVLTASGVLTVDEGDAFRRACEDRFARGVRDVVLDISHLTMIDSVGLENLLWLSENVAERGGRLRLVSPDENIRTVLRITRLDPMFDVHESVEEAGKSLR